MIRIELYTHRGAVCGMFLCSDMLAGQAGDQYLLPASMTVDGDDFDMRVDSDERALADGSAAWGGQVRARKVSVSGMVGDGSCLDRYTRDLLRRLRRMAARPNQYLSIEGDSRLCLRLLESCDVRWEPGWSRSLAQVRLTWLLADPFWQASNTREWTETMPGSGTLQFETGMFATWWMPPVVSVRAPDDGSIPSFTLVNHTDQNVGLAYADPGLATGAEVVIDCNTGSVTRGGADTIRYMSGRPLRLLPGDNVLAYTGNPCTITIRWHERWI